MPYQECDVYHQSTKFYLPKVFIQVDFYFATENYFLNCLRIFFTLLAEPVHYILKYLPHNCTLQNSYRIAGKFGEMSVIHQTKTIQITNYN